MIKRIIFVAFAFVALGIISAAVYYGWTSLKESFVAQGREEMASQIDEQRAQNARLRYDMEQEIRRRVAIDVDAYSRNFEAQQAERRATENMSRENIERLIAQNPDFYTNRLCDVPQTMLVERNRIRGQLR